MASKEKLFERNLIGLVVKSGGQCLKFTSPGHRGVSDRICLLPNGVTIFVEVKDEGKGLDPLQVVFRKMVEGLGHKYFLINSKESLQTFKELYL